MVKRRSRKTKTRKAARRPTRRKTTRRKTTRRKIAMSAIDSPSRAIAKNQKAHWDVYRDLQKKADKAWAKLRSDVKRKAEPHIILQDRNNLLLLLGECNYMVGECMRIRHSHTH